MISWRRFAAGKRRSGAILRFWFCLERELADLARDLWDGTYRHGPYEVFEVHDNKRRTISVASVRDRVVHRLLYDRLVRLYDSAFSFDLWSCRQDKGLAGAVERLQSFFQRYPRAFVWRADVRQYFPSVDQDILRRLALRRISDRLTTRLLDEIIGSYAVAPGRGMPIGNLTSQIFANIYLNEFDRYAQHELKPLEYLRYGDDLALFAATRPEAERFRRLGTVFLGEALKLAVNPRHDTISPVASGLHMLGLELFPGGRRLDRRNRARVRSRLSERNIASYDALVRAHENERRYRHFLWERSS